MEQTGNDAVGASVWITQCAQSNGNAAGCHGYGATRLGAQVVVFQVAVPGRDGQLRALGDLLLDLQTGPQMAGKLMPPAEV